jgi:hypothetical protein
METRNIPTKVIHIDLDKKNQFEYQLRAIAFKKIKQFIPQDFNGKPTLYDVRIERMSDTIYSVIAKVNNVKKNQKYLFFSVSISIWEVIDYINESLNSAIRSVASSTWQE